MEFLSNSIFFVSINFKFLFSAKVFHYFGNVIEHLCGEVNFYTFKIRWDLEVDDDFLIVCYF
jgi:NADH:ubiquinone oxidoreductase subunit 6 (subunit J)